MSETEPHPEAAGAAGTESSAWADLLAALFADVMRLAVQHVGLARAEMAEAGAALGRATLSSLAALLMAAAGLLFVLVAVALGLALLMPAWAAFLTVGAAAFGSALLLWHHARREASRASLVPRRTLASLQRQIPGLEAATGSL